MGHLKISKEEYNNEPIYYCKKCLSLRIRGAEGMDYCDTCGSTDVEKTSIENWESIYKQRFNHKYLEEY
jgi:hypothetical protein